MIKEVNKAAIITGDHSVSYAEMLQRIHVYAGNTPGGRGEKILIFSENREGWIYAFFGVWEKQAIVVPVDATSTVSDLAYIIRDCRPTAAWVSRKRLDTLQEAVKETGIEVKPLLIEDWERTPVNGPKAVINHESEDTALIIYTSGTTGSPKGVMLSFANLQANINGVSREVPIYNSERRVLILLPLHHVLPLMGSVIAPITLGGGVAICPSLSGPDIMETLCKGQVGIIIGVPRLWQTLYGGIKKKIDAHLATRALFALCQKVGSRKLSRLVFSSVHKKMGGHLDYCVSGGAALDREIGEGLKTLGLDVLEGYGMTETAPIITFTRPDDIVPGCVGKPLPSMECKLVNGELCAKGPNVMQGYYNRPEETAAVIDADGFIHTGDLAQIDEQGRVTITGRTKEIIVLSNGKNVQPNEIEYKLEKFDQLVKEAAVVQRGDMLCAIVVPQPQWAKDKDYDRMEEELKRQVLEPYNRSVTNYKKIMSLFVYEGDLPRTKLDKLQRFRLPELLESGLHQAKEKAPLVEPTYAEYQLIKKYIEEEKKIKVKPTDHIETDLAFDSLDKVSLQGFIDHTFGTVINADTMASYPNIAAIAERVADAKTRTEVGKTDWATLLRESNTPLELRQSTFILPMTTRAFRLFYRLYNRLNIIGAENIPENGPFILAPNHQSFLDGPLALCGVKWKTVCQTYSYASEEHIQNPLRRAWARRNNIILMERSHLRHSILKLAEVLKQGKNIVIFPEGSRTHDGNLSDFKKMFAILSNALEVPIVPVCINGAFEALPRNKSFIRPAKITIEYLPPIMPDGTKSPAALTKQVKEAIQEKLHI